VAICVDVINVSPAPLTVIVEPEISATDILELV
jgi:hypothetical protein